MKKLSKLVIAGVVSSIVATSSAQALSYEDNPLRKLGRGISNVALGVLEIPIKMVDVNKEEGGIAAASYGTLLGTGYAVTRIVSGAVEIVTFPAPLPGCEAELETGSWGYGPIVGPKGAITGPEFIVNPEHDVINIVHQDEAGVY